MGKFAGFLKRLKNVALKGVNTVAKGIKGAKSIWNNVITKPGVSILNTLLPGTKPLTDALFTIDNQVDKGIDWLIDKTSSTNSLSKTNNTNNHLNGRFAKHNISSFSNMTPMRPINLPTNTNLNFNR